MQRLSSNLSFLRNSAGIWLILPAICGFVQLCLKDRFLAAAGGIISMASLLTASYAAEFSVYNLDLLGYLAPAFSILPIVVVAGLFLIREGVVAIGFGQYRRAPQLATGLGVVLILLAATGQAATGWTATAKSDCFAPSRYAQAILNELPPNAIFLAGEDNSFLPVLCLQQVKGLRTDVAVLSGGALLRQDYRDEVRQRYPGFWYPADWDSREFAESFPEKLERWLRFNNPDHPVHLTLSEWTSPLIPALEPTGFCYRLNNEPTLRPEQLRDAATVFESHRDLWEDQPDRTTREHFARLHYNYAVYCLKHGYRDTAVRFAVAAAVIDETNINLLVACKRLLEAAEAREAAVAVGGAIKELLPKRRLSFGDGPQKHGMGERR
jgi:hypothetical protein